MTVPTIILNSQRLHSWQACPRRYLFEQKWKPAKWRLKSLFDACLRQAIFELAQATKPVADVALAARNRFLAAAASPGIDLPGHDPYVAAMDSCAMLDTVLRAIAMTGLPKLMDRKPEQLSDSVTWAFLSHIDDTGSLHRWITVDDWNDDAASRELHSWYCFGDLAAAAVPMNIHVIEIGQQRDGRRYSPWCRGYAHPTVAGRIKFQRTGGRKLQGDQWEPIWLSDISGGDPDKWVGIMHDEGVLPRLLHDIRVREVSESQRQQFVADVIAEATSIQLLTLDDPRELPMYRPACDGWVPCPFQLACYTEGRPELATLGFLSREQVQHR